MHSGDPSHGPESKHNGYMGWVKTGWDKHPSTSYFGGPGSPGFRSITIPRKWSDDYFHGPFAQLLAMAHMNIT